MRKARYVKLWVRYRAQPAESMAQRHVEVMRKMAQIGPPLGWSGLQLPPMPDESRRRSLSYHVLLEPLASVPFGPHREDYKDYRIGCEGVYIYRGRKTLSQDRANNDDVLWFGFGSYDEILSALNYPALLHEHFPKVIEAFRGYRARVSFSLYHMSDSFYEDHYCDGSDADFTLSSLFDSIKNDVHTCNPVYDRLKQDPSIDVDGRNNIYTLYPAQYWDAELCQRALGYPPQEVIARLQGKVHRVQPLMDGVYLVLNEEPRLDYSEFLQMNETYKPLLGLE